MDQKEIKPIKRVVRVTTEYEVEITLMPKMFGGMTIEEYIKNFNETLWDIDTVLDVAMYAARQAIVSGDGEYDGIGNLISKYSSKAESADVIYRIRYEDTESEVIE